MRRSPVRTAEATGSTDSEHRIPEIEPMTRKYFGTDGVRGKVGEPPITRTGDAPRPCRRQVLAHGARQHAQGRPTVLIGKDTRISGYMLEAALEAGFTSAGVNVLLTGPLPTPGIAYLTRALRLSAGVVISASHNPYYDNGIKFFSADGDKLPDAVELEIEAELEQPMGCVPRTNWAERGASTTRQAAISSSARAASRTNRTCTA